MSAPARAHGVKEVRFSEGRVSCVCDWSGTVELELEQQPWRPGAERSRDNALRDAMARHLGEVGAGRGGERSRAPSSTTISHRRVPPSGW